MKGNRVPPVRTPSRLYHHVFMSTPVNESRFDNHLIIGPEFVVRSRDPHREIQLKAASSEKIKNLRSVIVILLSGHRMKLQCNPLVNTLEQVFQAIINDQKIKFSHFLSLAFMCKGEFHFPDPKTKIYKVAPSGWDNNKNIVMVDTFTLYLRFLCYPRIENPRYLPNNFTNMLYLQLRHDFIEGRIHVSMPTMLSLASLTLQAEFGKYNKEKGEGYFLIEHYLPGSVYNGDENKEFALEKELLMLHRSLRMSSDMAKAQYISRIHGTLSYGSLIYQFLEEKQRKSRFLVASPDGIKVLMEPATFEKLLEADLLPWSVIKKFQISTHKLTIISNSKTKLKKVKFIFTDNRLKFVLNVCNILKRWQQKQLGIATAYFENSINCATQKNLFKSSSELNLHQSNGISRNPEATPRLQNCDNDNTRSFQKTGLSSSCMNLTEKEHFLQRRRLNSVFLSSEPSDSFQNTSKDLMSFAETTEYPDSSGNSCLMKKKSPKPNVVTYFPSEGNCSPVKATSVLQDRISLSDTHSINSLPEKVLSPSSSDDLIPKTSENSLMCESQLKNVSTCSNNAVLPCVTNAAESPFQSPVSPVKDALVQSSVSNAKKCLFEKSSNVTSKTVTSLLHAPSNVNFRNAIESNLKRSVSNANERFHKAPITGAIESLHKNGGKGSATVIKVTSFRETSASRFQDDVILRKNLVPMPELENHSDADFSPYSSPKKTSIGVKMGTKVTTAILQKHKLPRSGHSPCPEDTHSAIVIEPTTADGGSPTRNPEESVNDSLLNRFLAVPSPEFGLAERKLITVSITRSEGSLGITIQQAADGALYVTQLTPGSPAAIDGVLQQGDRLMGVNGFSVENLSCDRALSLLKSSLDPVQLLVSQPIKQKDLKDSFLEFKMQNEDNSLPANISEKHVTIIKVSTGPSPCDFYAANSLSPSRPISV